MAAPAASTTPGIALVASDLDGTLLRSDGTLSPRTQAAIHAARDAGIKFVFVTGRPPRVVHDLANAAGVHGIAVCTNGAVLYDVAAGEFLHHERLAAGLARDLIAGLKAADPRIVFATEHGHRLGKEPHFPAIFDEISNLDITRVDHAHLLCDDDLIKLLVHHPTEAPDALAARVSAHLGGRAEVTHSGGPFVEIGAAGVSKASGLALLCRSLAIPAAQVIAFGDMPNDVEMLQFAGRGVAVANAHPAVLAVADEVTASNDEDGVAMVLERVVG
jgi:hypothetical protein